MDSTVSGAFCPAPHGRTTCRSPVSAGCRARWHSRRLRPRTRAPGRRRCDEERVLTRRLTPWQQVVVGLWVAAAASAIYVRGQQVGIDRNVTSRLRFHAIPVAMSVLYHGRPHDYTAYETLA